MKTLRRMYLYGIAAIALALASVGAINLIALIIDQIWIVAGGRSLVEGGDDWARRQLSLYLPFLVIATPIWMLHWWLAERDRHGTESEPERRSTVRALFLTAVLTAAATVIYVQAVTVFQILIEAALGADLPNHQRNVVPEGIASLIIVAVVWMYHFRVRERDLDEGRLDGLPSWFPRIYTYVFSTVGLVMGAVGASNLLQITGDAITGRDDDFGGGSWWHAPLASDASLLVIGLLIWMLHWGYTLRVVSRDDWRGGAERSSRLRPSYLLATILLLGLLSLLAIRTGIESALRQILDVPLEQRGIEQALDVIGPPVVAIPFLLALAYQRYVLMDEGRRFTDTWKPLTAVQLYGYGLALLGLASAAVGAVDLLSLLIELAATDGDVVARPDDWWRGHLATSVSTTVVGGSLWLWHWLVIRNRFTTMHDAEKESTVRQAYLYLAFGASAVALIISSAIVTYQMLERVLGVSETGSLLVDVSLPLAVVATAFCIAIYHGNLLRREVSFGELLDRPEPAEGPARLELVLEGPPGSDLDAIVDSLSEHIPSEFKLHRHDDN